MLDRWFVEHAIPIVTSLALAVISVVAIQLARATEPKHAPCGDRRQAR